MRKPQGQALEEAVIVLGDREGCTALAFVSSQ